MLKNISHAFTLGYVLNVAGKKLSLLIRIPQCISLRNVAMWNYITKYSIKIWSHVHNMIEVVLMSNHFA